MPLRLRPLPPSAGLDPSWIWTRRRLMQSSTTILLGRHHPEHSRIRSFYPKRWLKTHNSNCLLNRYAPMTRCSSAAVTIFPLQYYASVEVSIARMLLLLLLSCLLLLVTSRQHLYMLITVSKTDSSSTPTSYKNYALFSNLSFQDSFIDPSRSFYTLYYHTMPVYLS